MDNVRHVRLSPTRAAQVLARALVNTPDDRRTAVIDISDAGSLD